MSQDQIQHLVSEEKVGSARKGVLSYLAGQLRKASKREFKSKTIEQLLEKVRAEADAEFESGLAAASRVDRRNKVNGGPGRQDQRLLVNGGVGRKFRTDQRKRGRPKDISPDDTNTPCETSNEPAAKKHKSSSPVNGVAGTPVSDAGASTAGASTAATVNHKGILDAPVNPDSLIGMWIKKNFEEYGDFEGQIISHDVDMSGNTIYRVKYRDDDEEDLFLSELTPLIQKSGEISK